MRRLLLNVMLSFGIDVNDFKAQSTRELQCLLLRMQAEQQVCEIDCLWKVGFYYVKIGHAQTTERDNSVIIIRRCISFTAIMFLTRLPT